MNLGGPDGSEAARAAGHKPASQSLLVADLVYGAWRAVVHGNPLAIFLFFSLSADNHGLTTPFFWCMVGALILGTAIVVATVAAMGGWSGGGRAIVVLMALDLCLLVASFFLVPGGLSLMATLWLLGEVSCSAALAVLNLAFFRRGFGAPGRIVGSPPTAYGARPIGGRPGMPAATTLPGWLYFALILAFLAWYWGVPFATTAQAARRGAEAGRQQGPPRIRSVWALPLYDGKSVNLYSVPSDARPAGMDTRSYRTEYAPRQGEAFVLVFGEEFRRVADQAAENLHLTVKGDGRPLTLEHEIPIENAQVDFRVTPAVNDFLRQPGQHTVQVLSGPSAASELATLDLGGETRGYDEWIQAEPRIHHVAAVASRPGALSLKILVSGLCRPMPEKPGFCTPGFISQWGQPRMEVACAVTVLGRREECRWLHPNVLEAQALYGKNEDAVGSVELEVGGRTSNRYEIRIHEMLAPWNRWRELSNEYYRGVAASPSVAAVGPAGLLAHLLGPALAIALFLMMRGWRGQVVLKSIAAMTLPALLAAALVAIISFVPLPSLAVVGHLIESISLGAVRDSHLFFQDVLAGVLVGLCIHAIRPRAAD